MCDSSPGHVNVLIHWGVWKFDIQAASPRLGDSPSRDGPSWSEREREGEKYFESNGDALRTAECHYAYRCGGGHSTPNLFPICIRARRRRSVLQPGRSVSSRARTRPHSITRSVSPSSTRARTSALQQPASIYFAAIGKMWIYLFEDIISMCLDDIRISIARLKVAKERKLSEVS